MHSLIERAENMIRENTHYNRENAASTTTTRIVSEPVNNESNGRQGSGSVVNADSTSRKS